MKRIGKLENLTFNDWNNIVVQGKKINRSWGKTYLYVRKGNLYYENLSFIKRIFCTVFFSKKVKQEKALLWEYLSKKGRVLTACPRNNFRQHVAHALGDLKNTEKEKMPKGILGNLIKNAEKEEDAFLIDFSQVNPSNILKIFSKGWTSPAQAYGEMILFESTANTNVSFPFTYSLNIVIQEPIYRGAPTFRITISFNMNKEGKIESCGKIFNNLGHYLEEAMRSLRFNEKLLNFDHLDIYSVREAGTQIKLRKKAAPMETA